MKKIKKLLASLLVLASVSDPALAQSQWTEIDNLISTSQDVVDILDEGHRRIGGASALVGTNIVGDNMLTDRKHSMLRSIPTSTLPPCSLRQSE
jgi:hypothetical protein